MDEGIVRLERLQWDLKCLSYGCLLRFQSCLVVSHGSSVAYGKHALQAHLCACVASARLIEAEFVRGLNGNSWSPGWKL